MPETKPSFADLTAAASAIEQDALKQLLDKGTAFKADLEAIVTSLAGAPGYVSQPKVIAANLLNALAFPVDHQIPQLLASYAPVENVEPVADVAPADAEAGVPR